MLCRARLVPTVWWVMRPCPGEPGLLHEGEKVEDKTETSAEDPGAEVELEQDQAETDSNAGEKKPSGPALLRVVEDHDEIEGPKAKVGDQDPEAELAEDVIDRGGIRLTEPQAAALRALTSHCLTKVDWFGLDASNPANIATLKGYAGTGKSTLIQRLPLAMRAQGFKDVGTAVDRWSGETRQQSRIVLTAPTNKAVKVLKRMAKDAGMAADCMTIYRLLGLALKTKDDKEVVEAVSQGYLDRYRVVVVDEASMLNAEIFKMLASATAMHRIPVLLVGDPCQLPPVGESDAPAFTQIGADRTSELTDIVRQAAGNPIIAFSLQIRQSIAAIESEEKKVVWPSPETRIVDGDASVGLHVNPELAGGWMGWVRAAFCPGGIFDQEHDSVRVVAWTNARVDLLNGLIHEWRYGATRAPYAVGEMIAFRKPVMDALGENVKYHTDTEAEVLSIEESQHPEHKYGTWTMEIETEFGTEDKIFIVSADGVRDFDRLLKDKAAEAKAETGAKRRDLWQNFWKIKGEPANTALAYAMTAHRAQGSTYQNVFVDGKNLLTNRDWRDAMRLLYVAVTRAQKCVVLEW